MTQNEARSRLAIYHKPAWVTHASLLSFSRGDGGSGAFYHHRPCIFPHASRARRTFRYRAGARSGNRQKSAPDLPARPASHAAILALSAKPRPWRSWAEPALARFHRQRTLCQGAAHFGHARREGHARRDFCGNGAGTGWGNEQGRSWPARRRWRGDIRHRSAGLCRRAAPAARIWFDSPCLAGRRLERWRVAKPGLAGDNARSCRRSPSSRG